MRLLIIAGIVVAAFGTFIAFKGLHVQSQGTVTIGPIHSTVREEHTVPPLIGWVAIVGGVLLVVAGARRKR